MAELQYQDNRQMLSRISGIKDVSRRLKSARDGFDKMEKDLGKLLSYQPSLLARFGKRIVNLIPVQRLQEWVNAMNDPLALAEKATRTHANDLQGGIMGLKKVTEEMWQDQGRIAQALVQAEEEQWDSNRLFDFVLEEAASGNLQVDSDVAELLASRQARLTEEERAEFARRIKEGIGDYLKVVDQLVQYVGSVGDNALELLGRVVMHYVAYSKLRPVVAELRDTGLAMTSASEGVFASRDLLIRHLQASQEAFMAGADAAEAMERFRIAGPEMVKMLKDADQKLGQRLKALQAPKGHVRALQSA